MIIKSTNRFPADKVKICKRDVCVEARGDNGRLIVNALTFAIVCVGIAAVIKAS